MRQVYWEGVGIPGGGRCTRGQGAGMPEGAGIPEGGVTQEQVDGSGRVGTYTHPLNMGSGYLPLPLHGTWDTHYPVLTPSGSQHNIYGWQAGGTHPTGMLS